MESHQTTPDACIVLTATVTVPQDMYMTVRTDHATRLNDYRQAFAKWLSNPHVTRIVLVENSGYDLSEFVEASRRYPSKRVECLSFTSGFDGGRGKGFGEMLCLDQALGRSELLRECSHIVKASGRYYLRNVGKLLSFLRQRPELDVVCNLRHNLTWADSRVFASSTRFLHEKFLPLQSSVSDSKGVCFEHVLARAAHQSMAEGGQWSMMPAVLRIEGVSATDNGIYGTNPIKLGVREAAHWLHLLLLGSPKRLPLQTEGAPDREN